MPNSCPNCNAPARDGDGFCRACGQRLIASQSATNQTPVAAVATPQPSPAQSTATAPPPTPPSVAPQALSVQSAPIPGARANSAPYSVPPQVPPTCVSAPPTKPSKVGPFLGIAGVGFLIAVIVGLSHNGRQTQTWAPNAKVSPVLATQDPAAKLRILKAGDSWAYAVQVTATFPTGKVVNGTGTLTETIAPTTLRSPSETALADCSYLEVNWESGQTFKEPDATLFRQNQNGDEVKLGDMLGPNYTNRYLTHPVINLPGDWSQPFGTYGPLNYSTGEQEIEQINIAPTRSTATLPTGETVTCWTRTETSRISDGTSSTTMVFSPVLGAAVTRTLEAMRKDGSKLSVSATLTSTNVQIGR